MSRTVAVPDFGDSGSLYQHVEVAEPGDPGYPTPMLPEGDPWAPAVNRAVAADMAARWGLKFPPPMTAAEVEAAEQLEAWGPEGPPASYAEWLTESQQELEAEL